MYVIIIIVIIIILLCSATVAESGLYGGNTVTQIRYLGIMHIFYANIYFIYTIYDTDDVQYNST